MELITSKENAYDKTDALPFRIAPLDVHRTTVGVRSHMALVQVQRMRKGEGDMTSSLTSNPKWYTVYGVLTPISENGCVEGQLFGVGKNSTHEVYVKAEADAVIERLQEELRREREVRMTQERRAPVEPSPVRARNLLARAAARLCVLASEDFDMADQADAGSLSTEIKKYLDERPQPSEPPNERL